MLGTHANPGIMVLTLNDLFYQMKSTEDDIIYNVTMSYMEVTVPTSLHCFTPLSVCLSLSPLSRFIMK